MVDSHPSIVIRFETHEVHPCFPYHVEGMNNTIKCTVIDEGVTTFVMSLAYWKGL